MVGYRIQIRNTLVSTLHNTELSLKIVSEAMTEGAHNEKGRWQRGLCLKHIQTP